MFPRSHARPLRGNARYLFLIEKIFPCPSLNFTGYRLNFISIHRYASVHDYLHRLRYAVYITLLRLLAFVADWIRRDFILIGLNLTACNNVILVDMWWNPALEVSFPPLPRYLC